MKMADSLDWNCKKVCKRSKGDTKRIHKQARNKIKQEELALKKQTEDNKIMMQNKEADMQFELKQQEIAAGQNTSANISTGYVRGF